MSSAELSQATAVLVRAGATRIEFDDGTEADLRRDCYEHEGETIPAPPVTQNSGVLPHVDSEPPLSDVGEPYYPPIDAEIEYASGYANGHWVEVGE